MSECAIRVEGLGKRYRIGEKQARYKTLRDTLANTVALPWRALKSTIGGRTNGSPVEAFWALKDINFELKRGEILGVVGRNGAGKSTLLKILSRITEPTEGFAEINGRVGSLLEVGTGFHPELTGRENIYLNGAILGMHRREIINKFDEIVDFAEVEKFIDTPVKHYSSGMYLRLAFGVAAHLEPEILVVDEVLAVGDAEFQKKCLGKMDEVASQGRTVLFVSHNMAAVQRLCQRGVVLQKGRIVFDGTSALACQKYLEGLNSQAGVEIEADQKRQGDGRAHITKFEVLDSETRKIVSRLPSGKDFTIRIHFEAREEIALPKFGFALLTILGTRVFNSLCGDGGEKVARIDGVGVIELQVKDLILAPGSYTCNLAISDRADAFCDYLVELPCFDVDHSENLPLLRPYDQSCGVIYPKTIWNI